MRVGNDNILHHKINECNDHLKKLQENEVAMKEIKEAKTKFENYG